MKRGGYPNMGGGMNNMQQAIKQAQKMQERMAKVQEELEAKELQASAGGGMVTVVVNGKKQIKSIHIQPEAVNAEDVEMLEDMVMAAVNEALRQMEELSNQEMGKVTGGLNLGGLF